MPLRTKVQEEFKMKIEFEPQDLEKIAAIVVERLKPLLSNNHKAKDSDLLTVEEVATYLKVKTSWVYEKIHTRQIPFHKVGKFPRFRKKSIDIWLENPYSSELSNFNLNINRKGVR